MLNSCSAYNLCESFEFNSLSEFCNKNFKAKSYKEVISLNFNQQEIHLFEYGVVIIWGDQDHGPQKFFSLVEEFFSAPTEFRELEVLKVTVNKDASNFKLQRDHFTLNANDPDLRLALSFALAQSIKLGAMEELIASLINKHIQIPEELNSKGKLTRSRKEMSQVRGEIFAAEAKITLKYDLLDKPEFLWDYPQYDEYYSKCYDYLEIAPRITVLSKKINVLRDIVNILSDELQFKHSTKLEWIIILLIFFEIVMSITERLYEYFSK